MSIATELTRRLKLSHPIFQAPLAGGGDTPELVAAVCNAGGLGFIGAAYLSADQIRDRSRAIRERTQRPFGINLFAPLQPPDADIDVRPALKQVAPYYAELQLPAPEPPQVGKDRFESQLAAVLESGASVFSFTFGILPPGALDALKRSMLVLGTATSVAEAVALEQAGVDAIVSQGSEAGGHRGSFVTAFEFAMIGTMALVPQVVDAVSIPVVASGGIMDGRGIAAALALGADAVQLGTAFLTCHEAGVPEGYKQRILTAHEDETRVTRVFSGRQARGLVNRFMTEMEASGNPKAVLPFPLQNDLTRPLRNAATRQDRSEYLSLWAGQGVRLSRSQSAADLVARLVAETEATVGRVESLRNREHQNT